MGCKIIVWLAGHLFRIIDCSTKWAIKNENQRGTYLDTTDTCLKLYKDIETPSILQHFLEGKMGF